MTTRSPFGKVRRWTIAGLGLALLAFGPSAWAQQNSNNRQSDDQDRNTSARDSSTDDDQTDQDQSDKDRSQNSKRRQDQNAQRQSSQDQQRQQQGQPSSQQQSSRQQQGNQPSDFQQSWQQPNSQPQNWQNQNQFGGQHHQQPSGSQQTFNAYSAGSQSPTDDQQYTRYNQNQYGQNQYGQPQAQNWQQNQGQPQYWQQTQNQQGQDWQQRQFSQNPNQFNQQGQYGQQDPNQNWQQNQNWQHNNQQNQGQQNQGGNEGPLGVTLAAHPTHGVQVTEVSPNTPASHAGLQVGDQIVAVNGQHIYSNEDLVRQIHQAGPQQGPLNLTVMRNGQTQHVQAALFAHGPINDGNVGGNQGSFMRERPALGITMHQAGPNQVRISDVMPGSPAQRAGLQPGDRIISIDHQPITHEHDVMNLVAQTHPDQRLPIEVERNGQFGTIWTTPEQANEVFGQGSNR